jgi:hypothetical protein
MFLLYKKYFSPAASQDSSLKKKNAAMLCLLLEMYEM